jgi:HAD superfamily hydrolase (TIGR01509 family)
LIDWKSPNIKQKLFEAMGSFPIKPEDGFVRAPDTSGKPMPYLICAYQAGRITRDDILKMSPAVFFELRAKNFFLNAREEYIIRTTLEGTFDSDRHAACTYQMEESVGLLKELAQGKKCRLIALSNWDRASFDKVLKKFPEAFACFNDLIISGDIKTVKPNLAAFDAVIQRHGLRKEDCVFIDDQPANIEAAKAYGIKDAILFTDSASLRAELIRLGIMS